MIHVKSSKIKQHYVTVIGFNGDKDDPQWGDFTIIDPIGAIEKNLSSYVPYSDEYQTVTVN